MASAAMDGAGHALAILGAEFTGQLREFFCFLVLGMLDDSVLEAGQLHDELLGADVHALELGQVLLATCSSISSESIMASPSAIS